VLMIAFNALDEACSAEGWDKDADTSNYIVEILAEDEERLTADEIKECLNSPDFMESLEVIVERRCEQKKEAEIKRIVQRAIRREAQRGINDLSGQEGLTERLARSMIQFEYPYEHFVRKMAEDLLRKQGGNER